MNRTLLWVGGALGALLIIVMVLVVVLLNTLNAQAEQRDYEACMARQGFAVDSPPPAVEGDDELDAYIGDIAAAAELCSR